jgi:hypothetical protein
MRSKLVLGGVIPANLLPFDADLQIDEGNYRKHIRYLVDTEGVSVSPPTPMPPRWQRSPSESSSAA